jgi:hypothetical protein
MSSDYSILHGGKLLFYYNNNLTADIYTNEYNQVVIPNVYIPNSLDISEKLSVGKRADFVDQVRLSSTTQSNNLDSGAFIVEGGGSFKKNSIFKGILYITNLANDDGDGSALYVEGGANIEKDLHVTGDVWIHGTLHANIDQEININIDDGDVLPNANINITKLGDGSINNAEFLCLDNIRSNIQGQIDDHVNDTNAHGVGGIIVGTTDTQSLTNKTLTHTSNDIVANKLRLFDGNVITINNTANPTTGQVLTATSGNTAEWRTNASGNNISYSLLTQRAEAISTTYTSLCYFTWLNSQYNNYNSGIILFGAIISDRNLMVQLKDVTNDTILGSKEVTTSGVYSFSITNPITDANLELQIKKNANDGVSPIIKGIIMEYTIG